MDIIMIRHGETEDNLYGVFGRPETSLTEKGINQIIDAREELDKYNYQDIYYSPLKRTVETMEYLGIQQAISEPRIEEFNFGIFTGMNYKSINHSYPIQAKAWVNDPLRYQIPDGDSMEKVYNRLKLFIEELIDKDRDVLLITHAGIIQLAFCWIFNDLDYFYRFKVDNGSINIITIDNKYPYISKLNSI